jgi:hypothetical protein
MEVPGLGHAGQTEMMRLTWRNIPWLLKKSVMGRALASGPLRSAITEAASCF